MIISVKLIAATVVLGICAVSMSGVMAHIEFWIFRNYPDGFFSISSELRQKEKR